MVVIRSISIMRRWPLITTLLKKFTIGRRLGQNLNANKMKWKAISSRWCAKPQKAMKWTTQCSLKEWLLTSRSSSTRCLRRSCWRRNTTANSKTLRKLRLTDQRAETKKAAKSPINLKKKKAMKTWAWVVTQECNKRKRDNGRHLNSEMKMIMPSQIHLKTTNKWAGRTVINSKGLEHLSHLKMLPHNQSKYQRKRSQSSNNNKKHHLLQLSKRKEVFSDRRTQGRSPSETRKWRKIRWNHQWPTSCRRNNQTSTPWWWSKPTCLMKMISQSRLTSSPRLSQWP